MLAGKFHDFPQTIADSHFHFTTDVSVQKSLRNAFQFRFRTGSNMFVKLRRFLVRSIPLGINLLHNMQQGCGCFILNGELKRDVRRRVVLRHTIDGNKNVVKSRSHNKVCLSNDKFHSLADAVGYDSVLAKVIQEKRRTSFVGEP